MILFLFGLVGFAPLADPELGCRWFGSRFGSRSPRRLRKLPSAQLSEHHSAIVAPLCVYPEQHDVLWNDCPRYRPTAYRKGSSDWRRCRGTDGQFSDTASVVPEFPKYRVSECPRQRCLSRWTTSFC